VLAACCAPPALIALDFAVISVVVPQVRTELDLGDGGARWFFSAYSVSFGCLLLAAGRAADTHGRRRLLLAGLGTFIVTGAATATASTAVIAIGGRAGQGAGAAMMTPAALSYLTSATAEGEQRTRALSAYGLATPLGFMAGTLATGVVATELGWRVAVAGSVVLAAVAAILAWQLPRDVDSPSRSVAAVPTPLVAALVAVAAGGALWRAEGVMITVGATAVLLVLAGRLGTSATGRPAPMTIACGVALAVTATATGATLLQTLVLHDQRDLDPAQVGLVFACFGAAAVPGAAVARRGRAPTGLVVSGLLFQALALGVAVLAPGVATVLPIVASVAGVGFGSVIASVGFAGLATSSAPASWHGALAGMLSTVQYLGAALGPPLLGRAGLQAGMAAASAIALAAAGAAAVTFRRDAEA
jgi:predicted MFS family arabinose efflux permease